MEHEAFLAEDDQHLEQTDGHDEATAPSIDQNRRFSSLFGWIFLLKLGIQVNSALLELPLLRLIEQKICRAHVGPGVFDVSESICKDAVVQDKLASIVGYKSTFDALPCVLTALFYGSLSNEYGRKPVMLLSVIGQATGLLCIAIVCFAHSDVSVEWVWFASAFLLIGGGIRLELSMLYTSFCDAVPWKQRTGLLSYLHASDGIAGMLGYPIGAALMKANLWYPFVLAFVIYLSRIVMLYKLPETCPYTKGKAAGVAARIGPHEFSTLDDSATQSAPLTQADSRSRVVKRGRRWQTLYSETQLSRLRVLCTHKGLNIIFSAFLFKRIGFASEHFIFQYASEILYKQITETFWLRVFNHLGMLLALGFIAPNLLRKLISPKKELVLMRGSLLDIIIGFVILWRGKNLVTLCIGLTICGLGEGLEVGLQSFGSYIAGEANLATFFPFASILGVVGELIGGPVMSRAYSVRLQDNLPAGLCFFVSVIIFTGLFASKFLVQTDRL